MKDQTEKLRSPCSAETDQRFALALVPVTPLSCLGYMQSARKADSKSVFEILSTVSITVTQKGHDFRRVVLRCIATGEGRVKAAHSFDELIIVNAFFSTLCPMTDAVLPSLLQNNGSLVWCQNHKQCSKVVWFHFFHERDTCHVHASLSEDNAT